MIATAQDTTPERIVEGFGAWEMRCQRIDPANPASALACEVTQEPCSRAQPNRSRASPSAALRPMPR